MRICICQGGNCQITKKKKNRLQIKLEMCEIQLALNLYKSLIK